MEPSGISLLNRATRSGSRQDPTGATIVIRPDGLVMIDGIIVFRRVQKENGQIVLQFCDSDKSRSACRGSRFVEIPLEVFSACLETQKNLT